MGLLIDSTTLIAVERGETDLAGLPVEELGISVITVSELLQGVHRATATRAAKRAGWVERLLAMLEPIPIDEPVARVHSYMWADLERRGERIGRHDAWIAATALTFDLGVATRNLSEFERIPGLRVVAA